MNTISIITCTYNAAATLPRTLESVALQDYPAVEHILIDGLSTDDTLHIIEQYRQTNSLLATEHTIILHSEKDDGLYYAMNKGISAASGDYLLFLNAGDAFPDEHTLSNIFANINNEEPLPAVLYGNTDIIDDEGHFLRHRRLQPPETLTWKDFQYGMLVCHQAFYTLTSIAKATPYDTHFHYSADFDWCIRVMKAAQEQGLAIVNVHQIVVNYLSEGLTTAHHRASLLERFRIMSLHYGLLRTLALHAWFALRAVLSP